MSCKYNSCNGLTSLTIPSSVTSIGEIAFEGCSGLTSLALSEGLKSIGDAAFSGCSGLTSVIIPSSVKSIGKYAFCGCSDLTSVAIPSGVTYIGSYAFMGCSELTLITIPSSVTYIGSYAFKECIGLTSVVVEASTPIEITDVVFNYCTGCTLYVPSGNKAAYQAASGWKNFSVIKEYPDHDVNQDCTVNVVDVVDIARYVVATPAESFDVFLADLNSDKVVNVADAVVLVNDIAGDTNWSRGMQMPELAPDDVLVLTENDDHSLSLLLEGSGRYTAFQFDLTLPADVDVAEMCLNSLRNQQHQLLYNKVGEGTWRVVALSTSNREFEGTSGELLNIMLDGFASDEVRIDNIHFVTAQGIDVPFAAIGLYKNGTATGLAHTSASTPHPQKVYNLNGQRMDGLHKGLNIVDGKKIVIR